jgi:hypothetical protein
MYGSSQALKFFKYSDSMVCGGLMFLLLNSEQGASARQPFRTGHSASHIHTYIIHETFSLPSAVVTVLRTSSLAR